MGSVFGRLDAHPSYHNTRCVLLIAYHRAHLCAVEHQHVVLPLEQRRDESRRAEGGG